MQSNSSNSASSLSILIGAAAPMVSDRLDEDVWQPSSGDDDDVDYMSSDPELEALLLGQEPVRMLFHALWPGPSHPFHQMPAPVNYPNGSREPDMRRRFTERLLDVIWWREHRHGRDGLPASFVPVCSAPTRTDPCSRGLQCPFSRHQQWRVDFRYTIDRTVLRCPFHPYLMLRSCCGCMEQRATVRAQHGGTRSVRVQTLARQRAINARWKHVRNTSNVP